MPYLNLKDAHLVLSVDQDRDSHPRYETRIRVAAPRAELERLAASLAEIFVEGGMELRVDLPQNWLLFFKQRESESRVLVAHPQKDEWVTTAALEHPHGLALIEALKAAPPGDVSVNALAQPGQLGGVSNVELVLALVG